MKYIMIFALLLSAACQKKQSTYSGHGADSLPDSVLKKYAAPPLPDDIRSRVERVLDIRSPSKVIPASDGKSMYFNWNVTGNWQVWKWVRGESFPEQLTGGEEMASLNAISPNDQFLIISRDSKGDEYSGLYLMSRFGGELVPIFYKKKVQAHYQHITDDSRYVYFRANDEEASSYNIYKHDLKTGTKKLIFKGKGYWYMLDKLGDKLILGKAVGNINNHLVMFDESNGKMTPLFGHDEEGQFFAEFLDEKTLILQHNLKEYRQLYSYNLDTKKMKLLRKVDQGDIYYFDIDRTRSRILFATLRFGTHTFNVLDAKSLKNIVVPVPVNDVLHRSFGSTSGDGRYTSMRFSHSLSPSKQYVYDWKKKELLKGPSPSIPEVKLEKVGERLVFYEGHDGTFIPMFVKTPEDCYGKDCPVIIHLHGGPESLHTPGFNVTDLPLLREGFIIARPNVRGSDGYGKKWLHADNGARRMEVLEDIREAANYFRLRAKGPIKIGVMGGSYGGYSTLMAMTYFAGNFDAGVAKVGMSSLVTFLQNTADYRRSLREAEYGYLDKDMEMLKKLSPMTYADQLVAPVLILHGATDPRVPAGEAVQFFEKIKKKSKNSQLVLFPDEGHGIRKRHNKVTSLGMTVEFFKKYLKN